MKQQIYIVIIVILVIVCGLNFVQINSLKTEMTEKDKMLWEAIDALDRKLDASNYKKDSQLLLMNRQHGNAAIHQLLADSCYNDCMKYRTKYGKEVAE